MNLKESFRYASYLETLVSSASVNLYVRDHALTTTKTHHKSAVDPEAKDVTEVVDAGDFVPNDDLIRFAQFVIAEREKLGDAITAAKNNCGFDIDNAIAVNKMRQRVAGDIKRMLSFKASKTKEFGLGYRFNVAGDQTSYRYEVETESKENFDRKASKTVMTAMLEESDVTSAEIDRVLVTTNVDFMPHFSVNDSFDDAVEAYLKM